MAVRATGTRHLRRELTDSSEDTARIHPNGTHCGFSAVCGPQSGSLTLLPLDAKMINHIPERVCEQLNTDGPPRLASRRAGCPTSKESNMRQHTHARVTS